MLAIGKLKQTGRYKQADKTLKQQKNFTIRLLQQSLVIHLVQLSAQESHLKKINFLVLMLGTQSGNRLVANTECTNNTEQKDI